MNNFMDGYRTLHREHNPFKSATAMNTIVNNRLDKAREEDTKALTQFILEAIDKSVMGGAYGINIINNSFGNSHYISGYEELNFRFGQSDIDHIIHLLKDQGYKVINIDCNKLIISWSGAIEA